MKKRIMAEFEAEKFLSKYIPIVKGRLIKSLDGVNINLIKKYPCVLKIISKDALHKSDVNGVRIVRSMDEIKKNFIELQDVAKKRGFRLDGILVQEFVEGKEIIIGINNDETFGHVLMLGIGGIFVELLKDVSFRVCPITSHDARSMINELEGRNLLHGFRSKPVNLRLLERTLIKVSKIPMKHRNLLELDINPFIINEKIGKVVDARMVFWDKK